MMLVLSLDPETMIPYAEEDVKQVMASVCPVKD